MLSPRPQSLLISVSLCHFQVRLRLLLDPSPPFVRTGTITFPTLPLIEIAAAPLKRNLANAMKIPGLKTYVLGSIKRVATAFVTPLAYTLDLDVSLEGEEETRRFCLC